MEDYAKGLAEVVQVNYRIDYATIPDHEPCAGRFESKWMPVLARKLRETDDTLQNIAAIGTGEVFKKDK